MSPRMTLAEVGEEFRKAGISIDNRRLADGIESGEFPFGRLINTSPGGRRTFWILRKDVLAYLNDVIGPAQFSDSSILTETIATGTADISKAVRVIQWATICPRHSEDDCTACPYRIAGNCKSALMADAASALMELVSGTVRS